MAAPRNALVARGSKPVSVNEGTALEMGGKADKRTTMPVGGYKFGSSNPSLRPVVPKGQ